MDESARRMDPFRILDESERQRHLERYAAFMEARDGSVEFASRRLARRDLRLAELRAKATGWSGDLEPASFARAFGGDRSIRLGPQAEWLLAAAKAAEGETYGVELELVRFERRGGFGRTWPWSHQDTLLHVLIQEHYHCAILREICEACSLELDFVDPGIPNKVLMAVIGSLPGSVRWILVLAGEVVGAELFRILLAQTDLFSSEPDVEGYLRALVREIWIDEVLHLAFYRAILGKRALRAAKMAVPMVARGMFREMPPFLHLPCNPEQLIGVLSHGVSVPAEVDWQL